MNNHLITIPIPKTRDPFVNAQLVPAGFDKETGEERFWISTYNDISGSTGLLITESGKHRLYHFSMNDKHDGFYGASYAGDEIMWLSCYLDSVTRLDLKTGETTVFNTGLPHELSLSGFTYDPITGKTFSSAYCMSDFKRNGFSFDTKKESVSKVFRDIPLATNQLRYSIRNLDGTYTLVNLLPGVELLSWDPVTDTLEVILKSLTLPPKANPVEYAVIISRNDGAVYLPRFGWFDPLKRMFIEGPEPEKETSWFAMDDQFAYGSKKLPLGNTSLYQWNFKTGKVILMAEIPDSLHYGFRMTEKGKIVGVNMYGYFYRVDTGTFALEGSMKVGSDAVGRIDCLHQIDDERLLCTPFITQRFFEINMSTGVGTDLGRATGGNGEVLKVTDMNGKIYMASYTKGQLVEYDPNLPARFPENPRMVVIPPEKAMRPVALCTDDETIFYSCSPEYGNLGSMMIRFTPKNNETWFKDNPIKNQMIRSLYYDRKTNVLLASTTLHADCKTCIPIDDFCVLATLDPKTMSTVKSLNVNCQYENLAVIGHMTEDTYLVMDINPYIELHQGFHCHVFSIKDFTLIPYSLPLPLMNKTLTRIYATEDTGVFIIASEETVELWNLDEKELLKELGPNPGFYNAEVQGNRLYLICKYEIHIYEF
ncbi:MAG: hypothetical protein JXQ23_10420 [Clostridia bacterium]|nr:hypothetical protein [Clostridia bacterium]